MTGAEARSRITVVAANRMLYVLVGGLGIAWAGIPWFVGEPVDSARSRGAVSVPEPSDPEIRALDLSPLARNPFDPSGARWRAERDEEEPTQPTADSSQTSVNGVVRMGPVRGVLTSKGFVAVGEQLNGGRLVDVGVGRLILSTPEGREEIPLAGSRRERIKQMRTDQ